MSYFNSLSTPSKITMITTPDQQI